ncbi:MAG: NTP transferase domain-containing protein [Treponemataceae bacterium]
MTPTLVVLAAGMGSRFGGIKQIEPVGAHNQSLLDYGVYDALKAGFGKIVFVIRKDIETDFCERIFHRIAHNCNAEYVFQNMDAFLTDEQFARVTDRKKPWGTVHAVMCAKKSINEPFAIINADDFYGFSAYKVMHKHLSQLSEDSTEHAMVGYVLKNTLSRSGTVSRGVCEVNDNKLVKMAEHKDVGYEDSDSGEKIVSNFGGKKSILTGEEVVSMNLFGFGPSVFQHFSNIFQEFLKTELTSTKAECLLPDAASQIVKENKGTISVYKTDEKWFGMTYREDLEFVRRAIAQKVKEKAYPEKLWEK